MNFHVDHTYGDGNVNAGNKANAKSVNDISDDVLLLFDSGDRRGSGEQQRQYTEEKSSNHDQWQSESNPRSIFMQRK